MRTSQATVTCPQCHQPAMLTLVEHLTGPQAGEQELTLTCPARHAVGHDEMLRLWAQARRKQGGH